MINVDLDKDTLLSIIKIIEADLLNDEIDHHNEFTYEHSKGIIKGKNHILKKIIKIAEEKM